MTIASKKIFSGFSRIWRVLPFSLRRSVVWVFICIFIQAILEVASILSISFLAISIAGPELLLRHPSTRLIMEIAPALRVMEKDPRLAAMCAAGLVALLIGVKNLMFGHVTWLCARLGERISLYTGDILFRQFLYSSYMDHLRGDSSEMFQSLSWRKSLASMTTNLMNVYTYFAITLALCATVIICTPKIILLVMFFLGLVAFALYKSLRRRMEQAGSRSAEWGKAENKVTLNAMRGLREALIYQQQDVFFEKFRKACLDGVADRVFIELAPPIPTWVLETAGFFVIFAAIALMIEINNASMPEITAVVSIIMLTAWRVLPLLNRSLSTLISVQGSRHAALECLKSVEEALDHPHAANAAPDPDFRFTRGIELRDATFSYAGPETGMERTASRQPEATDSATDAADYTPEKQPAERPCLRHIHLKIPRGKRVGIVGRSGAGKSTLILLLSGLAAPQEGKMLVDGVELSGAALAAYRKMVGFVPQNPYIMGGSIAENVAFSQWGRPWDEERVKRACEMAEFDVALQRGIEAGLGQDGAGLSGGQAQRLSIARALYADPRILIFDEATSALDTGVEKAIMETIYSLPGDITTITIAHRLDTVRRCDIIYWLEDGEIMASGPPEEILPRYKAFLESQSWKGHEDGEKSGRGENRKNVEKF